MKVSSTPILPLTVPPETDVFEDESTLNSSHDGKASRGREVVVFKTSPPPISNPGSGIVLSESPLKPLFTNTNARSISPRAIQELSLDLYAGGILSWEEHADLAFQAELHPDFKRTIGPLIGQPALPDQPRDYVKEWEQRLDFETRHAPQSKRQQRALRILSVLRRLTPPTAKT